MTREQRDELVRLLPDGRVRFAEPMARHSAMGVGGAAEAFVIVEGIEEIRRVVSWATERGIDYRFWGGGSRVLVRDGGLRGLVVKLGRSWEGTEALPPRGDGSFLCAGAAATLSALVACCAERGLLGLEGLACRAGTVGGGLIANTEMEGGRIDSAVEEITVVDRDGRELTMRRAALRFEQSGLKLPRTMAILCALFRVAPASSEEVQAKVAAIRARREEAEPVGVRSLAGVFQDPSGRPAAAFIEEAGLKGVRVGSARISATHANFIVNEGRSTARDVAVLMNLVRERVKEQTGVALEPAIDVIGEE